MVRFATRLEAKDLVVTPKMLEVMKAAKEVGLTYLDPRQSWSRLRNYEIESRLHSALGGEWVITEWCPFDGYFCSYRDVASIHDLRNMLRWHKERVRQGGYVADSIFDCIKERIALRGNRDKDALYPEGFED